MPVLVLSEAGFSGVIRDIVHQIPVLGLTAENMVKGFVEPESSCGTEEYIGPPGAGALDALQHFRKSVFAEGFHQHMNMVGHDDRCVNKQPVTVEPQKAFLYHTPNIGSGKGAGAITRVEPRFKTVTEQIVELPELRIRPGLGIPLEPYIAFHPPLLQSRLGKGVCQAEGDPIDDPVTGPVRQTTMCYVYGMFIS